MMMLLRIVLLCFQTFCIGLFLYSLQLVRALSKTYVVSHSQTDDIVHLLTNLGQIRSLLRVQMGAVEEEALIKHLW